MDDPSSVPIEKLHHFLGAHVVSPDRVRFCIWAPTHPQVWVSLPEQGRQVGMTRFESGYHCVEIRGVGAGELYEYVFGGHKDQPLAKGRPDPASRYQPRGVHGPSMVVASDYQWGDRNWSGVRLTDLIVYELHLGAFTSEGTCLAAIERLDELVDLGVTAIELMPMADAAGRWNWGYDGVNLFAPNRNYGTPEDLRRLVDAAHARGLAVFLDVVYNHLGPEGNYLGECGPYLSSHHTTVWGSAPNFDDPQYGTQLRRFFIANAIYWLDEYHFDGLRIDAIHCMRDDSETHVVAELSQGVRQWSHDTGRPAILIAESNVYDPNMLSAVAEGGMGFDAQWCDDFLHSVFAVARPGENLCHRQYQCGSDLDQTLRFGFVYEGTMYHQRGRRTPSTRITTSGLVYSIQHHDFIGNHPLGRRLHQVTSLEFQRAAAALMLFLPAIPMLFMGEEFACEQPFQFFVDFTDSSLRQAVVEGRRREYPQHDWNGGTLPIDAKAFLDSKIGPIEDGDLPMRDWYKALLSQRKRWRRLGLLGDANLFVQNDVDRGYYSLAFQDGPTRALVAVQLCRVGEEEDRIVPLQERIADPDLGELILDSRPQTGSHNELRGNHAKIFVRNS